MEHIYTFDEKKHVHMLDGKKLMGTTTVLGVIDKPALVQWAADVATANALDVDTFYPGILAEYEEIQKTVDYDTKKALRAALDKKYPEYKKARTAHLKKKDKAADWGTIVHKAIENWIKNMNIPDFVDIQGKDYEVLPEHRAAVDNFVNWAVANEVEFLESEKGVYSIKWWVGGIADFVCRIGDQFFIGDIKTSSDIYETMWFQTAAYASMLAEMGLYTRISGMVIINCRKDGSVNVKERFHIKENAECFEAALTLYKRLKQD